MKKYEAFSWLHHRELNIFVFGLLVGQNEQTEDVTDKKIIQSHINENNH